ncbi:MAG: hypothetical protein Q7S22_00430 [Candidatus Micrarchaeota archaeon]|nr:hypothetical protein [Candidatus Micrarchaeota archaeon]
MLASLASAETIIIPYQELPKSGVIAFNISAPNYENYTVSTLLTHEKVSLNYPVGIFSDNETSIPFELNYQVQTVPIVVNKTLNISLLFNSTTASFIKNITFLISVNHTIVDAQPVEEFQVINNTANIKLSFDTLPYNSSQTFLFKGIVGTTATVNFCGEWLSCPSTFIFNNQEEKVNISYSVPKNTLIGLYEKIFTVQGKNVTLRFNITEPTIIIPDLSLDECYAKVELQAVEDCINAKLELQKETLAQIFALARARQQNFTQIKEMEKLVMVGSVDKELKGLYDACTADLTSVRESNTMCIARRDELQSDREHFMSQLDQKQIEFDQQKESLLNETALRIQKEKSNKWWTIMAVLIVAGIICSIFFYRYFMKKYNHVEAF